MKFLLLVLCLSSLAFSNAGEYSFTCLEASGKTYEFSFSDTGFGTPEGSVKLYNDEMELEKEISNIFFIFENTELIAGEGKEDAYLIFTFTEKHEQQPLALLKFSENSEDGEGVIMDHSLEMLCYRNI